MRVFGWIVLTALMGLMSAEPGMAQNRFSPAIEVGDSIVTRWQVEQRTRFLALLGAPGDPRQLAEEQLVNEAVQQTAARNAGIESNPEEISAEIEAFAGRANLTADAFVAALAQNGVSAETLRDFIATGVVWRTYVRANLIDQARDIPQSLAERALVTFGTEGGTRVLVSEILLPASTPETARASRERAATLAAISTEEAFAAAARQFSVAPSKTRGGELNWVALDGLPPDVGAVIGTLRPGQVSRPVELENAIGLFLLRDVRQVDSGTPENLSYDYAILITGPDIGGPDRVADEADTCDDLYGIARDLPEERLLRQDQPVRVIDPGLRAELDALDQFESANITHAGQPALLMLCARKPALDSEVDLDIVGNRLLNGRLGVLAADHLADLRANTHVAFVGG